MSGGEFGYAQYRITEIIEGIEQAIRDSHAEPRKEDLFEPYDFKEETLNEFKRGIEFLKTAQIYAQRIDWLLSGDDGEETFHQRLSEDLAKNTHSQLFES